MQQSEQLNIAAFGSTPAFPRTQASGAGHPRFAAPLRSGDILLGWPPPLRSPLRSQTPGRHLSRCNKYNSSTSPHSGPPLRSPLRSETTGRHLSRCNNWNSSTSPHSGPPRRSEGRRGRGLVTPGYPLRYARPGRCFCSGPARLLRSPLLSETPGTARSIVHGPQSRELAKPLQVTGNSSHYELHFLGTLYRVTSVA